MWIFVIAIILDLIRGIWALTHMDMSPFWRTVNIILVSIEGIIILGLLVFWFVGSMMDNNKK